MRPWLRWGLGALAAGSLVVMLVFSDRLFSVGYTSGSAAVGGETEALPSAQILFDDDELVYDGSGLFSAMRGVTAPDRDGTDLTAFVSVSVEQTEEGETPSKRRRMTYSVRSKNGVAAKAERTLVLENYRFPSIMFTGAGSSIGKNELTNAARYFADRGLLSADDGFGHDITDSVRIVCDVPVTSSGNYTVTVTAENFLGDRTELRSVLYVDTGNPLVTLRLTGPMATVRVGKKFVPKDYVAAAYSSSSGDLTDLVTWEGTVDTKTPGTYQVTYRLTDYYGNQAQPAVLIVNVID